MSNQFDKDFWLNKVSQSRFFTSEKDVELLRFLIRSTDEGKNLKETIIAIEFFGRDATFDPGSDSIVRSNIYNLRKKLETYYLDEGANDSVRFIIPKGAYQVKIDLKKKKDFKTNAVKSIRRNNIYKLYFLVSLFIIIFCN